MNPMKDFKEQLNMLMGVYDSVYSAMNKANPAQGTSAESKKETKKEPIEHNLPEKLKSFLFKEL